MHTLRTATSKALKDRLYLSQVFHAGLINHRALARQIKPVVEAALEKRVSLEAIAMTLSRLQSSSTAALPLAGEYIKSITRHPRIYEATYYQSPTLAALYAPVISRAMRQRSYCSVVTGVWQTTIIADASLRELITQQLTKEQKIGELSDLVGFTVELYNNHMQVPGVVAYILNNLAQNSVNLVEVVSTQDETTIIVAKRDEALTASLIG